MGAGELLFQRWLAPSVRRTWGACFPGGEDDALALFKFSCATHDVGKASPSFVCQVGWLAERMGQAGLVSHSFDELREVRKSQPHSWVSDWAIGQWLVARGVSAELAGQVGSIAGAHHGRPAKRRNVREVPDRPSGIGRKGRLASAWDEVRTELIEWASVHSGADERWESWAEVRLPLPVQVGMTGLLIMADWMASNEALFKLTPVTGELSPALSNDQRARVEQGWADLALAAPWAPPVPSDDVGELYRARFGWADDWKPNPVQQLMARAAFDLPPGLTILESPMGSGKTEAALVAAEILAARLGLQGVLITLPTRATTNAMFERVADWLDNMPISMLSEVPWSLVLGHANAMLNARYAAMVAQAKQADREFSRAVANIHDDDQSDPDDRPEDAARVMAHQWFNGAKRRLLSNFAITTIDQLLVAGTARKHQMLNHLALASKVIVIDEAHASDAYMNVFLDAVLPWLGAYGVPVVVLSATLPPDRRLTLARAYRGSLEPSDEAVLHDTRYPLLTTVPAAKPLTVHHAPLASGSRTVSWRWHGVTDEDVLATLSDLYSRSDGCVAVIRSSVADAQATYAALSALPDVGVTLHHARFIAADRAASDSWLVDSFGREGVRPTRHVVVATQVVEQSLDVDFDLIITDLAPIDLLLQRVGRLHRHLRKRPASLAEPQVLVMAAADAGGVWRPTVHTRGVYGDHLLLRTAAVLQQHGPGITIPHDIASLVARVFDDEPAGPLGWADEMAAAAADHKAAIAKKRQKARPFVLEAADDEDEQTMADWFETSFGSSDEALAMAMVRDTDPTVEVLLVVQTPDGRIIRPPWHTDGADETLDVRGGIADVDAADGAGELSVQEVASWAIALPGKLTRYPERLAEVVQKLEQERAPRTWSWLQHPLLAKQLILVMHQTTEGGTEVTSELFADLPHGGVLRYTPHTGMEVIHDGGVQPD